MKHEDSRESELVSGVKSSVLCKEMSQEAGTKVRGAVRGVRGRSGVQIKAGL